MKDLEHYANRNETLITAFACIWFYFYFENNIAKTIALAIALMLFWSYFELVYKKPPKEIKPSCPFCGRRNSFEVEPNLFECRGCKRQWTN